MRRLQRSNASGPLGKRRLLWVAAGAFFCLGVVVMLIDDGFSPEEFLLEITAGDTTAPPSSNQQNRDYNNPPDNYGTEYPPLDCPRLLDAVKQNRSSVQDPNRGEVYQRETNYFPSFHISLHSKDFDYTRWAIMDWGHYYERDLINVFSEVLNATERNPDNPPRVLDVGGNIGYFSLEAAAHGQVVVDAFEPNMVNAFRMCQSLELNGWRNEFQPGKAETTSRVNCHPYGVGKQVGSLVFAERENPGQGLFREELAEGKRVQVLTLDAFAESRGWFDASPRPDIAILKIDVEGYEANVVQGARRLLESHMIRNVFMEVSARRKGEIHESRFFVGLLAAAGYDVYKYGGFRGPSHEVNWSGSNVTGLQDLVLSEVLKKKHKQMNLWWTLSPK